MSILLEKSAGEIFHKLQIVLTNVNDCFDGIIACLVMWCIDEVDLTRTIPECLARQLRKFSWSVELNLEQQLAKSWNV